MPNSKYLTHGISNLVSLITKTKLERSLVPNIEWIRGLGGVEGGGGFAGGLVEWGDGGGGSRLRQSRC
jgi:hypothetical protein